MISDEASNLSTTTDQQEESNKKIDDEIKSNDENNKNIVDDKNNEQNDNKMDEDSSINIVEKTNTKTTDSNLELNDMVSRKELDILRSSYENKLKQQQLESTRKENILIMRLTLKDQELQECLSKIEALKSSTRPSIDHMESLYLDPALNFIFEKLKKERDQSNKRAEEMQNDMNAWKFNSDSISGKQLMAKCRLLHDENEELGKMISCGKIAKLESGLAMHKNYSETLNKSQADVEEVLNEIEENVEGFQNTVYFLQQQLQQWKERYEQIEQFIKNCNGECQKQLEQQQQRQQNDDNNIKNNDEDGNSTKIDLVSV